jgi:hypothetical protein
MSQTLKTLINNIAAEVADLRDTKADRVELNACVRSVGDETGQTTQLLSLVKTGSTLRLNTEKLRATPSQIVPEPDLCSIDLNIFINNVTTDNGDPNEYLKITSDGQDLHVDYSGLLNHINTKAPGTSLSNYLRQTANDTGDTAPIKLIQLTSPTVTDSSGNVIGKSVNVDYSGLRTALSQKADANDPQPFMNYYARYLTDPAKDTNKLVYMTYATGTELGDGIPGSVPIEGATIGLELGNLVSALDGKAPKNHSIFDDAVVIGC